MVTDPGIEWLLSEVPVLMLLFVCRFPLCWATAISSTYAGLDLSRWVWLLLHVGDSGSLPKRSQSYSPSIPWQGCCRDYLFCLLVSLSTHIWCRNPALPICLQWPFIRVWGLQEPASVIFSLLNLLTNLYALIQFRRMVSSSTPMYYTWQLNSLVSCCCLMEPSKDFYFISPLQTYLAFVLDNFVYDKWILSLAVCSVLSMHGFGPSFSMPGTTISQRWADSWTQPRHVHLPMLRPVEVICHASNLANKSVIWVIFFFLWQMMDYFSAILLVLCSFFALSVRWVFVVFLKFSPAYAY